MTTSSYLEKDSATIYEELYPEEYGYYDEDDNERSSDRMDDMISKYGRY